jgi:uncharacterized membrane protein YeaQ/YmgE (transglycosylase-associated protein family)
MGIIAWIIFGLIAGALAKFVMPGDDKGGCVITTIIGIVGAVIGGYIGTALGWGGINGFDIKSFGLAILGAVIFLAIYRLVAGGRRRI